MAQSPNNDIPFNETAQNWLRGYRDESVDPVSAAEEMLFQTSHRSNHGSERRPASSLRRPAWIILAVLGFSAAILASLQAGKIVNQRDRAPAYSPKGRSVQVTPPRKAHPKGPGNDSSRGTGDAGAASSKPGESSPGESVESIKEGQMPDRERPERRRKEPEEPESPGSEAQYPPRRWPAEPGVYQAVRPTPMREEASDSGRITRFLRTSERMEVKSSDGDWLIVATEQGRRKRVYVNRDDTVWVSAPFRGITSSQRGEPTDPELAREIERELRDAGIVGVTVSLYGETLFLQGKVDAHDKKDRARNIAWGHPEVKHINNFIRVR